MIWNECPSETIGIRFLKQFGETFNKIFPISVITKNISPFYPTHNNMLQETGDVESGLTRHSRDIITATISIKQHRPARYILAYETIKPYNQFNY